MAGSIAQDTDKMGSWGLGDVLVTVLENEKEKREHEREMEKIKEVQKYQSTQANYANQSADNNTSSENILNNDLVKYGGVIVVAVLIYNMIN